MKNMNNLLISVVAISLIGCATHKRLTSLDPVIEKKMNSLETRVAIYKSKGAPLLSPYNYKKAERMTKKIEEMAYRGESLKSIQERIKDTDKVFDQIDENLELAKVHLADVLKSRSEAFDEGAQNLDIFRDADEELVELGIELEDKDINEILDDREDVRRMFVKAEIMAIDKRELKNARENMSKASKYDVISYFPNEGELAVKDIKSASSLIEQFKDSPERYRASVSQADRSSRRLLVLVSNASWIDQNELREVVLRIDNDLNNILTPLSYNNTELMTYENKVAAIENETQAIPLLVNELGSAKYEAFIEKREKRKLKSKNKKISGKLAAEKRRMQKIKTVQNMFDEEEARVYVQGDDLIIRLVGLNFDFNKAKLPENSDEILSKVAKTAKVLDYPDMDIIGHADSTGTVTYNKRLSTKRAMAVDNYLVNNSEISPAVTYIKGAGFKKPVSENKSTEGRKENRRVDIVFNSVIQQ